MGESNIEWTDYTFNGWIGCTKVSPGCAHCYAATLDGNRYSKTMDGGSIEKPVSHWGKGAPRHRTSAANWKAPLKWNRVAAQCRVWDDAIWRRTGAVATSLTDNGNCVSKGMTREVSDEVWLGLGTSEYRPRVFCSSLADWLDEEVSIEWLADLLELIRSTPNLDWLLLTKRPENWKCRMGLVGQFLLATPRGPAGHETRLPSPAHQVTLEWLRAWMDGTAPANVWMGTSVEDQVRADERIPVLLSIPARVRFLSCEPLLGLVNIGPWVAEPTPRGKRLLQRHYGPKGFDPTGSQQEYAFQVKKDHGIHWIICGGESGNGARPMHPEWARGLRDQCVAAGVAFFFKQWGEWIGATKTGERTSQIEVLTSSSKPPQRTVGHDWPDGTHSILVGKKHAGRLLDGREWNEVPGASNIQHPTPNIQRPIDGPAAVDTNGPHSGGADV